MNAEHEYMFLWPGHTRISNLFITRLIIITPKMAVVIIYAVVWLSWNSIAVNIDVIKVQTELHVLSFGHYVLCNENALFSIADELNIQLIDEYL